jgi:hypothetical protein
MIDNELMNKKVFSLKDLIDMGLIKQSEIDSWIQYQQAKAFVMQNFKGMF